MTQSQLLNLTYKINGAAINVHRALGPGLLESVYHQCMKHELKLKGLSFISEMYVPVYYKGLEMETNLRCDFLVADAIVVELKSVNEIHPVHQAQLMTYMKLLKKPKGILLNFNCYNLYEDGQQTFVNEHFHDLANNSIL